MVRGFITKEKLQQGECQLQINGKSTGNLKLEKSSEAFQ
jgi:hypothetical protein